MSAEIEEKTCIKTKAMEYFVIGLNVVPVRGKEPLTSWKEWQNKQQNETDFDNLPWLEADGFALIGGLKAKNGYYLSVIDFDVKNLSSDVVEKGNKIIDEFPATQTEETPSGGLHLVFWSEKKPRTISAFHQSAASELLGANKLIVMAPSQGYKKRNDLSPAIVQDLEQLFLETLEKAGVTASRRGVEIASNENENKSKQFWFGRQDLFFKPYEGPDPPCIRGLMKGVKEGLRNEASFRLSCYFANLKQWDPQKALRKVSACNKLNDPPIKKKELERLFASAIRGGYVYGCNDDILSSLCDPRVECPFRIVEEETIEKSNVVFDAETEKRIETEVKRVLESDNQLQALEPHLDALIVEEKNNKRTILVLLSGSKYESPDKLAIIILKGESRGGKSHLANLTLTGFFYKKTGRFTQHGLDYSELEPYEVIYVQELGELDEQKYGLSTLRFLSSDDQGYTVEYPVRDERTGMIRNEVRRIPPKTVISTTTRISIEHQFENRSWTLSIDESKETTRKVLVWKAEKKRQEDEKLIGRRKITDYEYSKEVLKRFTKKIKSHRIIIPFRKTITKIFKSESSLRIRGDIDKVYNFIELYGNFNLKRLQRLEINGEEIYAVTPEVAVEALEIIKGIISQMIAGIEPRTKEVLEALNETQVIAGFTDPRFTKEAPTRIEFHPNKMGNKIDKSEREQIARLIGKSEDTVRVRLNALCKSGYLSSNGGKGRKGKIFTLLYDSDEILRKLNEESGISMSPHLLIPEMEKEAREFLTSECGIQIETETPDFSDTQIAEVEKDSSNPTQETNPHLSLRENQGGFEQKAANKAENEKSRNFVSCPGCHNQIGKGQALAKTKCGDVWHKDCLSTFLKGRAHLRHTEEYGIAATSPNGYHWTTKRKPEQD
jgi:hypothetical protein